MTISYREHAHPPVSQDRGRSPGPEMDADRAPKSVDSGSRIVVLLSETRERTDYGAGFHRLAGSMEIAEFAAAGMSTVVAVNSATG